MGRIVLQLDPGRAPVSVANLLSYIEKEFYDGTLFLSLRDLSRSLRQHFNFARLCVGLPPPSCRT